MEEDKELIHSFEEKKDNKKPAKINATVVFVVVVVLGLLSGFIFSSIKGGKMVSSSTSGQTSASDATKKGAIVGSTDEKTFRDSAEGVLKPGGIDGEGAYHLERPGGDSQNVYLTSSAVDLSVYVNKKIKVWGETNKAQSAGWLMDVGRVQVL